MNFSLYIIPSIIAIFSMILGRILLKRHAFVRILPWLMSIGFLVFFIAMCFGISYYERYGGRILALVFETEFFPFSIIWAGSCMVVNFVCTLCIAFIDMYYKFIAEKEYLEYEKKYFSIYVLVTLIPESVFMLYLFHYFIADYSGVEIILFVVLEFVNVGICMRMDRWEKKLQLGHNTTYIKAGIFLLWGGIMLAYATDIGVYWYFSYVISCYFCHIICEIKRMKQDEKQQTDFLSDSVNVNGLIKYVSVLCGIVSCTFITIFSSTY